MSLGRSKIMSAAANSGNITAKMGIPGARQFLVLAARCLDEVRRADHATIPRCVKGRCKRHVLSHGAAGLSSGWST